MITFRKTSSDDLMLYFDWANDIVVRQQSYQSQTIDLASHQKWFLSKLEDKKCMMLVFQNEQKQNIGQVRLQLENEKEAVIGISVAAEHRGKGYASIMIQLASDEFLKEFPKVLIHAYIKQENIGSKKAFEQAGFQYQEMLPYLNYNSYHYTKSSL